MTVDPEIVAYIISSILGIVSIVFGNKYIAYKQKFADSEKTVIKIAAALKATSDAIEDDNLTYDEEQAIVAQWKDVISDARTMLKVE